MPPPREIRNENCSKRVEEAGEGKVGAEAKGIMEAYGTHCSF